MQKTVTGSGGSRREIALLHETVRNAAQSQISGNAAAGCSSTDYNDISFNHFYLFFFVLKH
jgi:hypothetical protein